MVSIRDALTTAKLPGDAGRLEAELLLCHCLGEPRSYLYARPEQSLSAADLNRYRGLLEARRQGRPIAYLTGRREFWSLDLAVDEHTLIPRPETETLVAWALELALPGDALVADWGTGSGAIALSLASERPRWTVLATDSSDAALRVAERNRARLGLDNVMLLRADWGGPLAGAGFGLIVSNPPYVAEGDIHLEQGDLRFEPGGALVAGPDGLGAIRRIASEAGRCLANGGWLLLEHGAEQGAAVRALLVSAGFASLSTRRDLAGLERITGGQLA